MASRTLDLSRNLAIFGSTNNALRLVSTNSNQHCHPLCVDQHRPLEILDVSLDPSFPPLHLDELGPQNDVRPRPSRLAVLEP